LFGGQFSHAVSLQDQAMGVVHEPIQDGICDGEPKGVAVCHMLNYPPDAEGAEARRTGLNRKVAITLCQLPGRAGGGIIHSW
jgi:hypothetical protein